MNIPQHCALFEGINPQDIPAMLCCLSAKEVTYKKGASIFLADQPDCPTFLVLSGVVHIQSEDYWGKVSILSTAETGDLFGESFCHSQKKPFITAMAGTVCTLLLIDYKKMLTTCKNSCVFHQKMIENMVGILAEKNVALTQKLTYLTQSTTKDKLLLFLSDRAKLAGSNTFTLPFTRQQLADFLSVERSAMTTRLTQMKNEGLIDFEANKFTLL